MIHCHPALLEPHGRDAERLHVTSLEQCAVGYGMVNTTRQRAFPLSMRS